MPLSCNHHSDKSRNWADWALGWTCQALGCSWAGSMKKSCLSWEGFAGTVSPEQWKRQHQQFRFLLVRIRSRGIKHSGHGFTEISVHHPPHFVSSPLTHLLLAMSFPTAEHTKVKASNSTRKGPNMLQPAQLLFPSLDLCSSMLVHNSKNKWVTMAENFKSAVHIANKKTTKAVLALA